MKNSDDRVYAQHRDDHLKRGTIFGVPIDFVPDTASLVDRIVCAAEAREGAVVSYLTADTLVKAKRRPSFRHLLGQCAVCYADGMGAALAASLILREHVRKVTANDCYVDLCREIAQRDLVAAFVGGEEGVAPAAAAHIHRNTDLSVAFCTSGYFTHSQEKGILAELARVNPHIVLVAMGQPRQEYYAVRWHHSLPETLFYCVGGLFDVMTGRVRTPPLLLRRTGFEWMWRLVQSPRSLWRRYLVGLPLLAAFVATEAVRTRLQLARPEADQTPQGRLESLVTSKPTGHK